MLDVKEIERQAKTELEEEEFRLAVEQCKDRLRHEKTFWRRMLPWLFKYKIVIVKRSH